MLTPPKRNPRVFRRGRLMLLLALALALSIGGLLWATRPQPPAPAPQRAAAPMLFDLDPQSLVSIEVSAPQGENYTLLWQEGQLWYQNEVPFPVDDLLAADILAACTRLKAEEVLAESLPDQASLFGLEPPRCTVKITHSQGEAIGYIGDAVPLSTGYYFMRAGDERLYRTDGDLMTTLQTEAGVLYPVEQVRLTGELIDRIALYDGSQALLYAYEKTPNGFAMTHPVAYPGDPEYFTAVTAALENFRLGAYVGPDSPAAREALGAAEYRLQVHQGAGSAAQIVDGVFSGGEQPAQTLELTLWPLGEEQRGYCAVNGGIYRFLRLSLAFLYDSDLSRAALYTRPAGDISVENLAALTVTGPQGQDTYRLLPGEEGSFEIQKNGHAIGTDAFEARLQALAAVTAGGRLPGDYTPGAVTLRLDFELTNGTARTLTLSPYDALHDAVGIDGVYLFYLIKGGLSF